MSNWPERASITALAPRYEPPIPMTIITSDFFLKSFAQLLISDI